MSLRFRNSQGAETPVAGLNGTSGELVPSVALQQSGTVNFSCAENSWNTVDVAFTTPMPDTDYLVNTDSGQTAYVHVQVATVKRTTGFTMIVWNRDAVSNTGIIRWTAFKLMTDTVHEADSAHIAQNTANFAPAFSEVTSYAVGDYCTYNNVLYRCTTAHTAGVWVAGHFTAVTVGGELMPQIPEVHDVDGDLVYYHKSGHMVTVVLNGPTFSSDTMQNARIGTYKFPKTLDSRGVYFLIGDYTRNNAVSFVRIDGDGNLIAGGSASDNTKVIAGRYWGSVTYPTAE